MATFWIYRSNQNHQWYWRLRAGNNEIVAWPGEGFTTQHACKNAVAVVKAIARSGRYERYTDVKGSYRWRLKASNGKIVAVSEGYTTVASRDNSITWMRTNAPGARVAVAAA